MRIKKIIALAPTALLLLGLSGVMIALITFVWPLVKASTYKSSEKAPSLAAPYVRLIKSDNYSSGHKEVAIDVYVNTAGTKVLNADIVIEYNPNILSISESKIRLHDNFASFLVNSVGGGVLDLSLFSNPHRGEKVLQTAFDEETSVATLVFTIKDQDARSTALNLRFSPNKTDETNLIEVYDSRPAVPIDILKAVSGIDLALN